MNDITALALIAKIKKQTETFDTVVLKEDEANALVEALEKAQRANAAQDDHINQQQDRIDTLEKRNAELGKYAGNLERSHNKLRESMAAIHNTVRLDGVNTRLSTILSASKRAYDESVAVSELESCTVTVRLPEEAIDQVCLAAAEIHNRGNGVSDDKAQFIINRIRNYLEHGGELQVAGIQVIEGEGQ